MPTCPITGNADGHQARDELGHLFTTFQLHRLGRAFLEQPASRPHALLDRYLVAEKGHVRDDLRVLGAARHHPAVVDHLVEGDRQGVGQPLHHHAQAVAHQHDVHARAIRQPREGHIVGRHRGDLLAPALALAQSRAGQSSSSLP
jgi:hypothetical protein